SANIVDACAFAQIAQRFRARLAGAHFEIHKIKFVAQVRMRVLEIFPNPLKRLIEREADLHADDGKIERVGQCDGDAALTVFDHALQHETRDKKAKSADADHQQKIEALLDCDHAQHSNQRQQHTAA